MRRNKILDVWEGEYRIFFNFYQNDENVTLGFPINNQYSDVYIKVNGEEQPRISISEAIQFLDDGIKKVILPRINHLSIHSGTFKSLPSRAQSSRGHCIRCGDTIDFDLSRPLCYSCYKSWSKYGNEDYEENFCHTCGREKNTSYAKPECYSCYRK